MSNTRMIINKVLIFALPVGEIPRPLDPGAAAIVSAAEYAHTRKLFQRDDHDLFLQP
jgi:hypothetical protein